MSSRSQSQVVYAAGLVQGIALVTFPAASTIFTSSSSYGLSSSQYGAMFLPQAVTAVGFSLRQGKLSQRHGGKPVYLAGLSANLAAMILLIASRFVMGTQPVAYPLLLVATACLGAGFGLTVPSINTFTAAFHLGRPAGAGRARGHRPAAGQPPAAVAHRVAGGSGGSGGLRARPGRGPGSRLLFAVIQRWFPSRLAYHLLPFVLAGAFVAISVLPSRAPVAGVAAFALAGFGCSALLPLTISFGQERLASMSAAMAGLVIAFYQLGYGIAVFGVGPLRDAGLTLPGLYGVSAVVAVALGVLSLAVAHGRPSPRSLHPRPIPEGTQQPDSELVS